MTTRINRYYNSPHIGQIASNLAGLFAPPDPQTELMYSTIAKQNVERGGLERYFTLAQDPNAPEEALERAGLGAGLWTPTQGIVARDMASRDRRYDTEVGAETARRGQDLTHSASVYGTNVGADTARRGQDIGLAGTLFGPRPQYQDQPELPENWAKALDLPAGVAAIPGRDQPMTAAEAEGELMRELLDDPEYGPMMRQGAARNVAGDFNVETVVDENGVPRIVSRDGSVGQTPYINPGSEAVPKAITLVDKQSGERIPGSFRKGQYYLGDGVTPADPARFEAHNLPSVTGAADDVGFGATDQRHANSQFRATTVGLELLDETLDRLRANPAALGFPGALTRLGQNALQTVDAVAQQFGGRTPTSEDLVAAGLIDREMYDQFFNPALPEIDVLINQLVWSYAQAQQGDRISNQQLKEARASLGVDGILATSRGAEQALNLLRERFERDQRSAAVNASPRIVGAYDPSVRTPGGAAPPAVQNAPAGGTTSTNIPFRILD